MRCSFSNLFPEICDTASMKRSPSFSGVVACAAIVEAERLFVKIAPQVEKLDRNVGSIEAALQQ
jgi:hypothetical protein